MEKQRVLKNTVIGVLLVAVLFMSIAFAAFSQQLDVNGTVNVASAANNWNVKFTAFESSGATGYATSEASTVSGTAETVTFTCNVNAPGDACEFTGTITNQGTIKASYTGAALSVDSKAQSGLSYSDDNISVEVSEPSGWVANTTTLESSGSGSFTVKVSAPSDATFEAAKSYSITVTFNFEQA
jgi:hypothetical protein